jgi:hypothetical protein
MPSVNMKVNGKAVSGDVEGRTPMWDATPANAVLALCMSTAKQ